LTLEEIESKRKFIQDSMLLAIGKAKKSNISEVEIFAGYGLGSSVGIEKNDIQSLESYEETVYGIRVIENGREGICYNQW
jgi:predicted Zn-dependent protease